MSEELEFPCPPHGMLKPDGMNFPDVPPEQEKDAAEWWMHKIAICWKPAPPG